MGKIVWSYRKLAINQTTINMMKEPQGFFTMELKQSVALKLTRTPKISAPGVGAWLHDLIWPERPLLAYIPLQCGQAVKFLDYCLVSTGM